MKTQDPKKNVLRYAPPQPASSGAQQLPKKTSFLGLITGSNNKPQGMTRFDNGVDPLGRLSVDSLPPPPPPGPFVAPVSKDIPQYQQQRHWVDELFLLKRLPTSYPNPPLELVSRTREFLEKKDPSSVDRAFHLALWVQENSEADLNAKLFSRFGEGLAIRTKGQRRKGGDGPVPPTLRELIRAFLKEHDPGFLELEGEKGLDDLLQQAGEYGMDSLESEFFRKYGVGLSGKQPNNNHTPYVRDTSSYDGMSHAAKPVQQQQQNKPPKSFAVENANNGARLEKVKSEKPTTFVELEVEDDYRGGSMALVAPLGGSRRHDFFDEKSLRADLRAFYTKHDPKKAEPQKLEPIVQWAYKIGPTELNRRFDEKYGESLTTFIDNKSNGRPGVAPGPKNLQVESEAQEVVENYAACNEYHEANHGKGFGVCVCGLSRVDHHSNRSLLVPGPDEPQFNKAKPKIVMSNNNHNHQQHAKPAGKPQMEPKKENKAIKKVAPPPVVAKFEIKDEGRDGPCDDYRLDMEGRLFGVCKCGWPKLDHNKRA